MMLHVKHTVAQLAASSRNMRAERGFSLLETMVALLIVLMISVIVAAGVPSAIGTYRNAVAGANAEVALSTMTTVFRDELGAATAVTSTGSTDSEFDVATYKSGSGFVSMIENGTNGIHSPVKVVTDFEGRTYKWTLAPDAQLATTQENLYVDFEKITFDPAKKVFRVYGLRVYENKSGEEKTITSVESEGGETYFAIKAPYCKVE